MNSVSHSSLIPSREELPDSPDFSSGALADGVAISVIGCVLTSLVSIAAASFFLGLALLLWLLDGWKRRKLRFVAPAFGPWIAGYVGAILISIVYSLDPAISVFYLLKLLKLSLPFLILTYLSRRQVLLAVKAIFAVMTMSALLGIFQFFSWEDLSLLNRVTGFMSHWMTFSGQLMLVLTTLSGFLLFGVVEGRNPLAWLRTMFSRRTLLFLAMAVVCSVALVLTYTRSAWLGYLVAAAFLILMWDWRWLFPSLAILVAIFFFLPGALQQRLRDGVSREDRTMQGRIELIQTGSRMLRAHPLTGVGPRMVPRSAPVYRTRDDFPDAMYVHLHNSPLQIAAEFGLLTLLFWLGLWGYTLWSLGGMARRAGPDWEVRWLAINGAAAIIGFLCAGILEFNFGDAEVLILLFFLITAPYVVARRPKTS